MRRKKTITRWSASDTKKLRQLAGKKRARAIGRLVKRSEAAVRFKAHALGLSLAVDY
jgi:hypothetical protein